MRRAMILAACVVLAGMSPTSVGYTLSGSLGRHNGPGGIESYALQISLSDFSFPAFVDDAALSIETPTGAVYGESIPVTDSVLINIDSIAPGDIDTVATGIWTIREQIGAEVNVYEFTLPEISSSPLWAPHPEILSPADGSVVPPVFGVALSDPSSWAMQYRLDPPSNSFPPIRPDISSDPSVGGIRFSFEEVPDFRGTIEILVGARTRLLPFTITRVSPTGSATFSRNFSFTNYAPSITLTVVPEPSSVVLAILVGVGLVAARRVRWNR